MQLPKTVAVKSLNYATEDYSYDSFGDANLTTS